MNSWIKPKLMFALIAASLSLNPGCMTVVAGMCEAPPEDCVVAVLTYKRFRQNPRSVTDAELDKAFHDLAKRCGVRWACLWSEDLCEQVNAKLADNPSRIPPG